jgi:Ca2+-binding RTX toxin-like protein
VIGTTGDDVLCGNSGPNYFYTKGGHDVVRGLGGTDSLDFEGYAAVTIDMPIGRATGSWGRVDFSSIEDFYGTPFADTYNGYSGPDHFYGKSGNDKAYGKGGDDRLHGDAGDDYLDGGTGANYLDGGADTDTCLNGATLVACEATATTTSAWAIQRTTPGAAWAAGDRRRRLLRVE